MTDRMTPQQRHRCMSHIHSRNTKPELLVRRWLWNHGYRYRLCVKSVPGKPDIVMRSYRTAIFINGCFWHGHNIQIHEKSSQLSLKSSDCCRLPQTNREFWSEKIISNKERDQRNYNILRENGWNVIVIWECQLTNKLLGDTMNKVEIMLNDNFLSIHRTKPIQYSEDVDCAAHVAAESLEKYGEKYSS